MKLEEVRSSKIIGASTRNNKFKFNNNLHISLIFILVIFIPFLLTGYNLFYKSSTTAEEKLALLSSMDVKNSGLSKVPAAIEDFYGSKFVLRDKLITWSSWLKYRFLSTSNSPKVIVGNEGRLFSADKEDGDAISDFRGTNLFTEDNLAQAKEILEEKSKWLKTKGAELILVLPPNPETIYSENMPFNIKPASNTTRLEQTAKYLQQDNLFQVINLKDDFLKSKQQGNLYYKTEDDITDLGAYNAYEAVINGINKSSTKLVGKTPQDYELKVSIENGGNLAEKLGLEKLLKEEKVKLVPKFIPASKEADVPVRKCVATEINNSKIPKAVMFMDNYGKAMMPFLSENFSRIVYKLDFEFDTELVEKEKPDFVIYEISEKNLSALLMDNPENVKNLDKKQTDFEQGSSTNSSSEGQVNNGNVAKPLVTFKTMLTPDTYAIGGKAENGAIITVTGGTENASTRVTDGSFLVSVKLQPNKTNSLKLYAAMDGKKDSEQVELSVAYDNSAPTKPVVIGKDGRLFASETIADYTGTNLLTEDQLRTIKQNLESKRDWLKADGRNSEMLVVLTPDPITVYQEYAPDGIKVQSSVKRIDQVVNYLRANSNLNILDLREPLISKKDQGNLYYKTDTHWNELGAYYGYSAIINELGKILPNVNKPIPLENYKISKSMVDGGDLVYYMKINESLYKENNIGLTSKFKPQSNYSTAGVMKWMGPQNNTFSATVANNKLPKAVMFRDSYTTNLMPYLSEHFRKIVYYKEWDYTFDKNLIGSEKPDVVIYQYLEKNIDQLMN